MRRPNGILNLRFHVHWLESKACAGALIRFNIHAICLFAFVLDEQKGRKEPTKIYNFIVDSNHERNCLGETAYFVCCASCWRHLSALVSLARLISVVSFHSFSPRFVLSVMTQRDEGRKAKMKLSLKQFKRAVGGGRRRTSEQQMAIFHSLIFLLTWKFK